MADLPVEKERRFLIELADCPVDLGAAFSYDIAQSYLFPPSEGMVYTMMSHDGRFRLTAFRPETKPVVVDLPLVHAGTLPLLIEAGYADAKTGALSLPDNAAIRARTKRTAQGPAGEFAIKIYQDGIVLEFEAAILPQQALDLIALAGANSLLKRRHELVMDGYVIELDIFRGNLSGLAIVEIEERPGKDIDRLVLPDWFGPEITGMREFCNAALAENGAPWPLARALLAQSGGPRAPNLH